MVHGQLTLNIIDDPAEIQRLNSPAGKPFIRLTLPGGTVINLTMTLAEMVGHAASGARQRYEDQLKRGH